jgi:sodium/potassium-transporting ATPase subunit alpha
LVPGDLVVLEFGKRIPADVRITESQEMKVDNSSLTGESLLLLRTPNCTNRENPLETKNLAFFGTLCKEGSGKGIVLFTGDNTVIGQIAGLASSAVSDISPLRKELNRYIAIILSIALVVGVIFFCLGFIVGYDAITNLLFAVGIIVGFVPEGLQATVTVGLTLTAKKLAGRNVLVKNLEGVETLGSAYLIFFTLVHAFVLTRQVP